MTTSRRLDDGEPVYQRHPRDVGALAASSPSSSIPLYFQPVRVRDGQNGQQSTLVDGGVLSNFPIEIFDRTDAAEPRWPTFGVTIIPALPAGSAQLLPGIAQRVLQLTPPTRLLEQVAATAIVGHDQTYLERPCVRRRAIEVDTSAVGIVEFNAPKEKREEVVANGEAAAGRFLDAWEWERFKEDCRSVSDAR